MSFIPQRISVGTVSSVTGISGSGTSGQVAYFSGATQLSSQDTFTFNGTDITMTCPTANPLIIKALSGNSNGLRVYCNTASDDASIVNFYNANLEIGTNNTVYQTITGAGVTTFGGNTIARKDQNATTTLQVRNDNAGASAAARVAITSDQGDFSIFANSAAGGDTVALTADSTFGGGMDIGILGANALRLNTNGSTGISLSGAGLVTVGVAGGSQTHRIEGDGLSFRRSASTVTFDISNGTNDGGITLNGDTGVSAGACLQVFGGSHASNPSYTIFRNANVQTGSILNTGVWSIGPNAGGVTHRFNTNTQTTVGAAGAASALPANPTGYWLLNINGTTRAIPYYANA